MPRDPGYGGGATGTSISDPFGGAGGSGAATFAGIDSLFNAAQSNMFGGGSQGNAFSAPNTLNTGRDLTADIYSGFGQMNALGQPLYNFGGNLAGLTLPYTALGTGITQGGLGLMGQGFGTVGQGINTLAAPTNFYQQLLAGNPSATAAALGPTANNLSQIYSGAMNASTQGLPEGGYRAATMAGLPQAQAAQVGNAALGLQPLAAQGLQSIGGQLGQMGGLQAGIGQGVTGVGGALSGLGLNLGGLGLNYANAGMGGVQQAIADMLTKEGQNYSQPSALQQATSVLGALTAPFKFTGSLF